LLSKNYRRTPRNYDGCGTTGHQMSDLLPVVLRQIGAVYQERPDLVLAAWPEVIGSKLASMTEAVSFTEGVLVVRVTNSTLYSLLNQHEKPRLLQSLRYKFPRTCIKTIFFRHG